MGKEIKRTELGKKLKELRDEKELTLKIVSEALGIKLNTYGKYERNIKPKPETLIKIAEFFDVSIDYLMGREDKANDYAFEEAGSSAGSFSVDHSNDYQSVENDLGKLDEREILLIKKFRAVSEADKLAIAKYASKKEDEDKD